jgi:dTDP-4-amino-4,6-dideoxygalactose transaminase
VFHLFVVTAEKRNELRTFLKSMHIDTGLHYPVPLHLQPCFASLGYQKGDFPLTEHLADSCISLPMFPEITEEQVRYVADQVKSFYATVNKKQLYLVN